MGVKDVGERCIRVGKCVRGLFVVRLRIVFLVLKSDDGEEGV